MAFRGLYLGIDRYPSPGVNCLSRAIRDGTLNQIGGAGRVVLPALGATQRAWESARLGHGFLSLDLLEALQGQEEIGECDQVGLLRVLDYVVKRGVDAARQIRREQQPAV